MTTTIATISTPAADYFRTPCGAAGAIVTMSDGWSIAVLGYGQCYGGCSRCKGCALDTDVDGIELVAGWDAVESRVAHLLDRAVPTPDDVVDTVLGVFVTR